MVNYPIPAIIVGSVLSSVSLIAVNKEVFKNGFPFVLSLSAMHFVVTFALLMFMGKVIGAFEVVYLPRNINIKVGTFGVLSIALMNYSLKYNSVGMYQISKLCVIPCVMLMNVYIYKEAPASKKIRAVLTMVIFGVGVSTVTDVQLTLIGLVFACFAVLTTSQFQIWQGRKQAEHSISGIQCACSVSVVQMTVCGIAALLIESGTVSSALSDGFVEANDGKVIQSGSSKMYMLIMLSCLLAVSVNVHGFLLIGKTSVVTYQVIGHAKTCLILSYNYILFILVEHRPLSDFAANILGVLVAFFGVVCYSNIKVVQSTNEGVDWIDRYAPSKVRALLREPASYAPVGLDIDEELGDLAEE